ncbi:hypothetical protein AVEN_231401-1 [Araneus ventricosus]|uniref:Uncharacterized protein n=1 Tax=Araneus ventricosus TaxID=182803 RepID=A0A4Y2QM42_ARAVE|nr:hypothetical protein AVEN_224957-1 [Araneus ventricosus]GBN64360.1 hypothetical protein AVEN_231401-1 [Araneus ventricosus]
MQRRVTKRPILWTLCLHGGSFIKDAAAEARPMRQAPAGARDAGPPSPQVPLQLLPLRMEPSSRNHVDLSES